MGALHTHLGEYEVTLKEHLRVARIEKGDIKTVHLTSGEKSVGELADLLEIPQSPLSQHLARMRKESLVVTRREAQTIYYSLKSGEAARIVETLYELFCASEGCAVTWESEFMVAPGAELDEVEAMIRGVYEAGLGSL